MGPLQAEYTRLFNLLYCIFKGMYAYPSIDVQWAYSSLWLPWIVPRPSGAIPLSLSSFSLETMECRLVF
jgi:hypothetical protein